MASVRVDCGICDFTARIEAKADSEGSVQVGITCDCPRVKEFAQAVAALTATCAAGWKCADFFVYEPAAKANLHPACPVPVAVLKALEVAAGLAEPRDTVIRFEE